jgi:DNA-binding CsgD family transcriptional regulator
MHSSPTSPSFEQIDFYQIFLKSPVGMCISNNRCLLAYNQAFAAMFLVDENSLIGSSFSVLYPSAAEFERTGERITPIMNAKGVYSDERIMKRSNQELFWCHVSGRAIHAAHALGEGIWTFEDLSAKRSVSAHLTPREREISALLAQGKTSKSIAKEINLSPRTIEMYRAKLMKKLNAQTAAELIHRLLHTTENTTEKQT